MPTDPNGFFEVSLHSPTQGCVLPWRPMSELGTKSAAWTDRVVATRAALGSAVGVPAAGIETRVAASVAHLGICARIIAPVLARAAEGILIDTELSRMWWQPTIGGPFPLSVQRVAGARLPAAEVSAILRDTLIDVTMGSLVRAVRTYSVSPTIAWGNVASALQSAAAMLAAARPAQATNVRAIVHGLSTYGPLAEAGDVAAGGEFRRNSCCLIYRVAGDRRAVCADCILGDTSAITTRRRRASRR